MDAKRWQRLGEIFEAARVLPPGKRDAYLDRECRDDRELRSRAASLILHDAEASGTIGRHLGEVSAAHPDLAAPDLTGQAIGPYVLVREVARGGMGEVYEAEQSEPVRRRVALKLIKHGMDTREIVARFSSERQALAMMDHPCIARVFDAGASREGRPFFAMEYVDGLPITRHCDQRRLPVAQRLELFIMVCEGVQHAHQKAIIHRDIKPSNVLVSVHDGKAMPKIIDFGIAKATAGTDDEESRFTRADQIVGTPEYMSPEQARSGGAEVDTRSDVYSLGVLLHELLTGDLPYRRDGRRGSTPADLRRLILEEEVPRPSTRITRSGEEAAKLAAERGTTPGLLRRELSGDLDWIVLRALARDPAQRYGSPADLAADLRRHLENEPVQAAPPATGYRVRKFVRRHRGMVIASLATVLVLVGFAATMAVQNRRIARERDRANMEARTAGSVSDFLTDLFKVADPGESRGDTITAREILERGSARLSTALADQPEVQAHLLATMGTVYQNLGLFDESENLLTEALRLRRQLGPGFDEATAESLHLLGALETDRGDHEAAAAYLGDALDLYADLPDADPEAVANTRITLAHAHMSLGRYDEAERLFRQVVAELRRDDPDHPSLGAAYTNLGQVLHLRGDLERSAEMHRASLANRRENLGDDHPDVAESIHNLAVVLHDMGDLDQAEALYRQALDISLRTQGAAHPDVADTLVNLGRLLRDRNDLAGAEEVLLQTLEIDRTVHGAEHENVAYDLKELAELQLAQGRTDEAEGTFRRSLAMYRSTAPPDSPFIAVVLRGLAGILVEDGRAAEGEPLLREAVALTSAALAPDHWLTLAATADLGACLGRLRRFSEGEPLLVDSYQAFLGSLGADHRRTRAALAHLVRFYEDWGRTAEAARYRDLLAAPAGSGAGSPPRHGRG